MSLQSLAVKAVMRRMMARGNDITSRRISNDEMSKRYKMVKDVTFLPEEIAGVSAEWSIPQECPDDKVIFHLHGGGYCMGSIASHRHFVSRLALETSIKALCIAYRLAPEHPFPDGLEDTLGVYRALLARGILPKNIILTGDSAGGGLALAAALALRDQGEPLPGALALFSSWTDLTMRSDSIQSKAAKDPAVIHDDLIWMSQAYAKGQDRENPLISPRFGSFVGLPPMFIHTGTDEILADDSIHVAEKAQSEGVKVTFRLWKGMFHTFTLFPTMTPEGKKSFKALADFIRHHLHG